MWIDRRWLVLSMAFSGLLNIFLVGVLAGRVLAENHHQVFRFGRQIVTAARVQELPADEMQRYRAVAKEHRPAIRAARRALRAARNDAENDIGAPTFDKAKVTADLAAMRRDSAAVQEAVHASLVDALEALSPASRASLVAHHRASTASAPGDHD